jgi:hypothetical protein
VKWQQVQTRSGISKKKSKQIQKLQSSLRMGRRAKINYASNIIEQHESRLNRRSSKPSCHQSADGNWDHWLVISKVTKTTLLQSAGGNWEGRQSRASDVVYAETIFTFHTHKHFNHHDSRSARIASAGVWWRGYPQDWMLQHADTDVQNRPPATLLRRRSRTSSHEPFIINSRK